MIGSRCTRLKNTAQCVDHSTAAVKAKAAGIAIVLFPSLTAADLYLSADRSGILPVNATVFSFLCLSCTFGSVWLLGLIHDRGRSLCLTYLATAPVLVAFALLTVVQLVSGLLPAAYWISHGTFVYMQLYVFVVLMLSVGIASAPAFRQYYRIILLVCLFIAVGSIYFDMLHPKTFSKLYSRPSGFTGGPNSGAETAILLTIAAVDWKRSRASDMLVWMISGAAIVATLSRHGILLLAVMFLLYCLVIARSGLQLFAKRLSIVLVAVAIVVPLYSITNLSSTVYSADNKRLQLLSALLSGDSAEVTDDPRVELVGHYLDLISEHPILGYGAGYIHSQPTGPHNTYLSLWLESGLPGLVGYLILLFIAFWYFRNLRDMRGQAFCAGVAAISFFTNDLMGMRPMIVTLGLLSVLALPTTLARSERARARATRTELRSSAVGS
jgi:O-antigen ligase